MTDEEIAEAAEIAAKPEYPEGDYAIVEVLGHVKHVGLWQETERFGQKFCEIRPIKDHIVGEPILVGGASIYQFRTCTAEYAYTSTESWDYRRSKEPAALLTHAGHGSEDDEDELPFEQGYDFP